jgi:hypothetical protein
MNGEEELRAIEVCADIIYLLEKKAKTGQFVQFLNKLAG